jgi:hypothetical protein
MSEAQPSDTPAQGNQQEEPEQQTVIVVGPNSMGVAGGEDEQRSPADMVEHPAKVMRIGSMIKQLLEEVRDSPLDEAGRARLAAVHERSMAELEQGLSPELVAELRRISLPFDENSTPSDAELRIAQAQLVGWLEGLFHGIQTALVAQQMAAQAQIAQMRRALPGGPGAHAGHPGLVAGQGGQPGAPGTPGHDGPDGPQHGTGQYL